MVYAWVALKERKFNTYRAVYAWPHDSLRHRCLPRRQGLRVLHQVRALGLHDQGRQVRPSTKADLGQRWMPRSADSLPARCGGQRRPRVKQDKETDSTYVFTPVKKPIPSGGLQGAGGRRKRRRGAEEPITLAKDDIERAGNFLPAYGTYLRDLLHRHRPARAAHHRRRHRHALFPHHRFGALQAQPGAASPTASRSPASSGTSSISSGSPFSPSFISPEFCLTAPTDLFYHMTLPTSGSDGGRSSPRSGTRRSRTRPSAACVRFRRGSRAREGARCSEHRLQIHRLLLR